MVPVTGLLKFHLLSYDDVGLEWDWAPVSKIKDSMIGGEAGLIPLENGDRTFVLSRHSGLWRLSELGYNHESLGSQTENWSLSIASVMESQWIYTCYNSHVQRMHSSPVAKVFFMTLSTVSMGLCWGGGEQSSQLTMLFYLLGIHVLQANIQFLLQVSLSPLLFCLWCNTESLVPSVSDSLQNSSIKPTRSGSSMFMRTEKHLENPFFLCKAEISRLGFL